MVIYCKCLTLKWLYNDASFEVYFMVLKSCFTLKLKLVDVHIIITLRHFKTISKITSRNLAVYLKTISINRLTNHDGI